MLKQVSLTPPRGMSLVFMVVLADFGLAGSGAHQISGGANAEMG